MMTIRSHDQYNTTIYGLDDRYRGIRGNRYIVLMNEDDVTELGFKQNLQLFANSLKTSLYSSLDNPTRVSKSFGGGYTDEPIPTIPIGCGVLN